MASQYRVDSVGSLLRPPELVKAREDYSQGRITDSEFNEMADKGILQALAMQKDAGMPVFTDGEYRRVWWAGSFVDVLEGIAPDPTLAGTTATVQWNGPYAEQAAAFHEEMNNRNVATEKLRVKGRWTAKEAAFLKMHSPGPWKITIAPPAQAGVYFRPGISDQAYASADELMDDMVGLYQNELRALAADGCTYIQMDSLFYAMFGAQQRAAMSAAGLNPETELEKRIAWDNALIEGLDRSQVTVGLHMCRGNNQGAWLAEGDYEATAEKAFNSLNVDRFLMEFDTPRAGSFEPLRFMPRNKTAVLGLVSTKTPELESQDELLRRIDEATKYVPLENLAIATQCGFASAYRGNPLTWDDQKRKIELLVDTSQKVWG